ncbi:DUF4326 domain-containing protein [Nocardia cyriacigeorgica]|uniref:DUF4326 domain-containing protein n=1 Tax=Nocardia cyriacigeorgica TaxID=135487 RepID=UPI0018937A3C|nr:DUF4326 domain-containing protein [Nocardia cyriacigeorgica]MBF6102253.1 DUF4326 domain-containing protein [Nocardia cyriacigeorgica]
MTPNNLHTDPAHMTITELATILTTGAPVVVSMRAANRHAHLIDWARRRGLFVRIDRATDWGNPYIIGSDGNRDDVIDAHAQHLPRRPDLLARLRDGGLAGKVLGCWCAPQRCHGHTLAALTLAPDSTPLEAVRARPRS